MSDANTPEPTEPEKDETPAEPVVVEPGEGTPVKIDDDDKIEPQPEVDGPSQTQDGKSV